MTNNTRLNPLTVNRVFKKIVGSAYLCFVEEILMRAKVIEEISQFTLILQLYKHLWIEKYTGSPGYNASQPVHEYTTHESRYRVCVKV